MAELRRGEGVRNRLPPIPARAQILAVAWMRWRIFVNGLMRRRPKKASQIAGWIFSVFLYAVVSLFVVFWVIGPVVGSGFLAWLTIVKGRPQGLAPLLFGLALLWQFVSINGVSMAATAPSFDPSALVRFPLRFGRYFVLRSLLGLLTASTIVGSLALLAVAVGLGIANSALLAPALAAMTLYALMNIYLTRAIGAWMERWLANRRFREIFSVLMLVFGAGVQFLNLRQTPAHAHGARGAFLLKFLASSGPFIDWLPPGFAARAILRTHHPVEALFLFAGLLASAVLFAAIFAIRLRKQFHGEHLHEGVRHHEPVQQLPRARASARARADRAVFRPARATVSPVVLACLRKDWLILRSSGMQFIRLLTPLFFLAAFSMGRSFPHSSTNYLLTGAIAYTLIGFLGSLYNSFGADGRGAQLYLLAPIRLRDVVLAKNLLSLAMIAGEVSAAWAIVCLGARVSIPASTQASTALWTIFVVALNLAVGTLRSIQAPRYFDPTQARRLRPVTPTDRTSALLVVAVLFGSLLLQIPVMMASRFFALPWLGVWIDAPLATAAVLAYALVLCNTERLILAHRDVLSEELCKV